MKNNKFGIIDSRIVDQDEVLTFDRRMTGVDENVVEGRDVSPPLVVLVLVHQEEGRVGNGRTFSRPDMARRLTRLARFTRLLRAEQGAERRHQDVAVPPVCVQMQMSGEIAEQFFRFFFVLVSILPTFY